MRSPLSLEDGRDSEEREVFYGFAYFPEYFQKKAFSTQCINSELRNLESEDRL